MYVHTSIQERTVAARYEKGKRISVEDAGESSRLYRRNLQGTGSTLIHKQPLINL